MIGQEPPIPDVGAQPRVVDGTDVVELRLPARSRWLRLARLIAAGVAGDAGFDLDGIEELRVAVDELCAVLIDGAGPDDVLALEYRTVGRSVRVEGRVTGAAVTAVELHPVARELLEIVADEYELYTSGIERRFRLRKDQLTVSGS